MTLKLNGTNSEAAPAYAGDDADTGLQCGTNELKLVTGGTARATVDSSGRLLVGTSSTSATCTSVFAGRSDGATDPVLRLEVNSTSPANGTALGGLNFASSGLSAFQAGARIAAVRDGGTWTNGSSHPTYLEFATTADGASSPTERMRILSSGGITFNGDTAAANALNDYEEGFFTPTLVGSSGGAAASYTHQNGGYVKVGNVVHVYGYLKVSSKGTSISGSLKVGGFPFSVKNNTNYYHAPGIGWYTGFSGVTVYGLGFDIAPNATDFTLARGSGTGVNSVTLSQITDTFGVEWAFTYRTE